MLASVLSHRQQSEEDQQLKNELEMLIERLKVRHTLAPSKEIPKLLSGTQYRVVPTCFGDPAHAHSYFNFVDDFRAETFEVLASTLS